MWSKWQSKIEIIGITEAFNYLKQSKRNAVLYHTYILGRALSPLSS